MRGRAKAPLGSGFRVRRDWYYVDRGYCECVDRRVLRVAVRRRVLE
jgi:hypothetical protein